MENKPFWETAYSDRKVSAFSKGPTADVKKHFRLFPSNAAVLDVGCGEGRNSVFMAKLGSRVDAFDISAAGIEKARQIAEMERVSIRFFVCDLADFVFEKPYDIILSHGVLHLPHKETRDSFIRRMQENTTPGGIHHEHAYERIIARKPR